MTSNPYIVKERIMPLALVDVMKERELKELCQGSLQYSSLVSVYRRLSKNQLAKIFTGKTSFLDLLMNSGLRVSRNDEQTDDIQSVLTKILSQKIWIGLMAVDKIPIENIISTILHMDSSFASDDLISKICLGDARLMIGGTGKNKFVTTSHCMNKDADKKKKTANRNHSNVSHLAVEKMRESLVRYFCKSRPDLLRGLQLGVEYKDMLKVYEFWSGRKIKSGEFVSWLLDLARTYCKNDYGTYEQNIYIILCKQIVKFVTVSNRTVAQIVDNFCFDKPSFINDNTITKIVLSCPNLSKMSAESHSSKPGQQVITIVPSSENLESCEGSNTGADKIKNLQAQRNANEVPKDAADEFALPHDVKSRLISLLTLKSTISQILQIYNVVHTKAVVKASIEKYGCFLGYLIEFGRHMKPKRLGGTVYGNHLKVGVIRFLMESAKDSAKTFDALKDITAKATTHGFINDDFLRDALNSESVCDQEEVESTDIDQTKEGDTHTISDRSSIGNAIADLESPRVMHLLTRQPCFGEICNVFAALSKVAVQTLARNSMSFFEWMISLCKRLMPYDADGFESHLQKLVQVEVANLHASEHCQMTTQHVHNLLCGDMPMLLSPNFISYCLEQPGSALCVYQSWIYLRTGNDRVLHEDNATTRQSIKHPTEVVDCESFIEAVRTSSSLQQIISLTNCISIEKRENLMRSVTCWFEFIENHSTRRDRTRLSSLLVADVDRQLGDTVLKLENLWLCICRGSSRFITAEILEEILRQHSMRFALSRNSGQGCYIARVRSVEEGRPKCVDSQEEKFLEHILFYFPSSGSCNFSTILRLAEKEGAFLHIGGHQQDANFLQCFFFAFPMLFYVYEDSAILTCMALDFKLKCKRSDAVEDSQRGKKRAKDDRRHRKQKTKKLILSTSTEPDHKDVICIIDSEEESICQDGTAPWSNSVPSPDTNIDIEETIKNLLPGLVGDMTMSLLQKHGGHRFIIPLVQELVPVILGQDEALLVVASAKYWSMFKRKIVYIVKMDPRFETMSSNSGQEEAGVTEVTIAEDGVYHDNREASVIPGQYQVEEVTSTSVSSVCQAKRDDYLGGRSSTDNIIKFTPPRSSGATQDADQLFISYTDKDNSDQVKSPRKPSDATVMTPDNDFGELVVDTARGTSEPTDDVNSKQTAASEATPYIPSYVSLSSGSTAYKYIQASAPKRSDDAAKNRVECFHVFTRECLGLNAGSYATELLIADAHRRFRTKRFARSRLAFEAYAFDFIVKSTSSFSVAGTSCDIGVSKVTFKNALNTKAEDALNIMMSLIPDIPPSCAAYLRSRPNTQDSIDNLTQHVVNTFRKKLEVFPATELYYAARCLTLVSMIRNLKLFCFDIRESLIYLRIPKEDNAKSPKPEIATKIKTIIQSERLRDAMLLMASIVKRSMPTTHKKVRELWQAEAPASFANVFGNGISFTLAMREYAFLFPPSVSGEISVNADAIEMIRKSATQ